MNLPWVPLAYGLWRGRKTAPHNPHTVFAVCGLNEDIGASSNSSFMPKCLPWDYGLERGQPHLMTTFLYPKGSDQAKDNESGEGGLMIIVMVGQCHPLSLAIFISCLYGLRKKMLVASHELMPLP